MDRDCGLPEFSPNKTKTSLSQANRVITALCDGFNHASEERCTQDKGPCRVAYFAEIQWALRLAGTCNMESPGPPARYTCWDLLSGGVAPAASSWTVAGWWPAVTGPVVGTSPVCRPQSVTRHHGWIQRDRGARREDPEGPRGAHGGSRGTEGRAGRVREDGRY